MSPRDSEGAFVRNAPCNFSACPECNETNQVLARIIELKAGASCDEARHELYGARCPFNAAPCRTFCDGAAASGIVATTTGWLGVVFRSHKIDAQFGFEIDYGWSDFTACGAPHRVRALLLLTDKRG